jgi:succinate dehydrogenase / fumarate reductase, iron-sulfur subunit
MKVALKIWCSNAKTGERALREYEVEAPEWVTLLDVLDVIKDRHDGTLAFRKSCRMMICGSCGMRMDGAAVLACKTRMYDMVQAGHVPVISAMGNLPILKDLVVDMDPFWAKFKAVNPYLKTGYEEPPPGREFRISQKRMNAIQKEALCINCGACVSECNAMESDPDFLGPQALAKAMRFVGDPRDAGRVDRLEDLNGKNGIWQCTRCYFCNERCPKGVDPRDAIAKLGAESVKEGIDRDMGAKHAKWFVTSAKTTGWLRETELVPHTQGIVETIKQTRFALALARRGKVPPPFPPHVAKDVKEARLLYDLVQEQGRAGYEGIVQGEAALAKLAHGYREGERDPYGEGSFPRPYIAGEEAPAS